LPLSRVPAHLAYGHTGKDLSVCLLQAKKVAGDGHRDALPVAQLLLRVRDIESVSAPKVDLTFADTEGALLCFGLVLPHVGFISAISDRDCTDALCVWTQADSKLILGLVEGVPDSERDLFKSGILTQKSLASLWCL
jgi:hypothetical protein